MVLTVVGVALLFSPELGYGNTALAVLAMAVSMICTSYWLDISPFALRWDALRVLVLSMLAGFLWLSGEQGSLPLVLGLYCVLNALALPWLNQRPTMVTA